MNMSNSAKFAIGAGVVGALIGAGALLSTTNPRSMTKAGRAVDVALDSAKNAVSNAADNVSRAMK